MRLGGTEQHAVRHDDCPPAAHLQHSQKQRQEQQLGLFGLAEFQQVGGNDVGVQTALKRRVGQNQGVLVSVGVLIGQAVPILNKGVVDAVGHHVHGADSQHRAVHVEAVEHVVHVVVFFLPVKEDLLFMVLFQVLPSRHQKARCTTGRVADHVVRRGGHQIHHHLDDVARCAELAVDPGCGNL